LTSDALHPRNRSTNSFFFIGSHYCLISLSFSVFIGAAGFFSARQRGRLIRV
jgi:hypothetical protein